MANTSSVIANTMAVENNAIAESNMAIAKEASGFAEAGVSNALRTAILEEAQANGILTEAKLQAIAVSKGKTLEEAKEIVAQEGLRMSREKATAAEMRGAIIGKITQKLSKTKYGALMAEIAAKLGIIKVNEGVAASEALATAGLAGFLTLAAPLAAIALGFAALAAYIHHVSEEQQHQKEIMEEAANTSNALVATIIENKENLDSLYRTYQFSGKASDEFKEALLKQAKALNINNAELLIATGQYTKLKEEIDAATLSELQYNEAILQSQLKDTHVEGRTGFVDGFINKGDNATLMEEAGIQVD
jgi:hypothetical protein